MMACKRQALIIFLLSLFTLCWSRPDNGHIAVYWGQNNGDGDLRSTCDSGHYKIVILAFLVKFGGGRPIDWNFAGHCDHGAIKRCTELESEIKYCQVEKKIQVFLSIGGDSPDYSLSSAADAKEVANILYNNFLSGQYGPLGSVTLNGIDFDIERTEDHWDELARELDAIRRTKGPYFYLSAAPQCPTNPVYFLGKAIATKLFNYIFVQFYNNPGCSYSNGNAQPLLDSWDKWVNLVAPNNTLFVGLPASPSASGSGYIDPQDLIQKVLPHLKTANNYGGVMLWDRHHDIDNDYSGQIQPYVFNSPFLSVMSLSDAIYQCVAKTFHRVLPTRVTNY